ncbi:MAG: alpha/beta fold hydrolase [Treponema sp.]|nr:alpha/beta fold hydrolase [Treponema sp.]
MYKPVELKVDDKLIRGCVRTPQGPGPFPAVCFYHGFSVDKVGLLRLHEMFARMLVDNGFACVRFDFYGCGESDGNFSDMRVSDEIIQGKAIYEWTLAQDFAIPEKVYPVGHSLGGVIASIVAASYQPPAAVLWSPALSVYYDISGRVGAVPDHYEKTYDLDGLDVSGGFFEDVRSLDFLKMASGYKNRVLVIHGEKDEKIPAAVTGNYRDLYGKAMKLVIVKGCNHQFSSMPWRQQAYNETVSFLLNGRP